MALVGDALRRSGYRIALASRPEKFERSSIVDLRQFELASHVGPKREATIADALDEWDARSKAR
jgi:hypothetical protein